MMNDPRKNKFLEDLINRPESLSGASVQPEAIDDALAMKVEEPDSQYDMPEDIKGAIPEMEAPAEEPEIVPENIDDAEAMKLEAPVQQYQPDSDITTALRKLKSGQPSADDAEVTPETIEDPSMDSELRKAALMKVKQKYLGR